MYEWDSVVGIATRNRMDGSGFKPLRAREFSLLHTRPDLPWKPPSLLYKGYGVSCQRVRRPGRGVDSPLPFHVQVTNVTNIALLSVSASTAPLKLTVPVQKQTVSENI